MDKTWEGWHKQEGFVFIIFFAVDVSSLFSLTCLTEGDRSATAASLLRIFPT